MGGIILRCLAKRHPELITGNVVMLAPPNQGSEIIDWLEDSPLGRLSLGPGGMSLSTNRLPREVPPFDGSNDVSVIMGRRNMMPVFDFLVEGIKRLEVVDADHTFIMGEKLVLKRIAELLKR
jgi:hypothetical protein